MIISNRQSLCSIFYLRAGNDLKHYLKNMSDTNELDWEEYEAITQYIYGALGAQQGINVRSYGRNCKIKGKSTVEHQIDVLTEQFDGERHSLTAIECKYWNKKVDKDVVMKLAKVMDDSGITSGIIVCKAGFTRDTLTFAEHEGIKLVQLWEAGENDANFNKIFEIGTANINFNVMLSRPKITSIDFGSEIIEDEEQIMQMYFANLHDSNGGWISFGRFVAAFSEELQTREDPLKKSTTIDFPLNRKLFYEFPEGRIVTDKISITGFITKSDRTFKRSFQLTDQVWMIMNELFDKRKLTLSKSGLIWNLPSGC